MKILVSLRSVYGSTKIYPVNEEAVALARIAGTKTLEPRVLAIAIRHMGATVQVHGESRAEELFGLINSAIA